VAAATKLEPTALSDEPITTGVLSIALASSYQC
jgi:hypothetical protein